VNALAAERFAYGRMAFVFDMQARAHHRHRIIEGLRNHDVPFTRAVCPQQTAIVDVHAEVSAAELPTTLLRSKADMPEMAETASGAADAPLLQRVGEAMTHMRLGSIGGKKMRRKDGPVAAAANAPGQVRRRHMCLTAACTLLAPRVKRTTRIALYAGAGVHAHADGASRASAGPRLAACCATRARSDASSGRCRCAAAACHCRRG
jgi:hypothetical protein